MAAPRLHGPLPVISRDGLTPSARPAKRQPRPVGLLLAPKETLSVHRVALCGFLGQFLSAGTRGEFFQRGKVPSLPPSPRGVPWGSARVLDPAGRRPHLQIPPEASPPHSGQLSPRPHQRPALVCVPQRKCPSLLNSACRGARGSPSCPGPAVRSGQWGVQRGSCSALLGFLSANPSGWAHRRHTESVKAQSHDSRKEGALAKWAQGPQDESCGLPGASIQGGHRASRRSADTHSEVLSGPALPAGQTGPPGSWGTRDRHREPGLGERLRSQRPGKTVLRGLPPSPLGVQEPHQLVLTVPQGLGGPTGTERRADPALKTEAAGSGRHAGA